MKKLLCSVYRSPRKEGLYLYLAQGQDCAEVPAALLQAFGEPALVLTLKLTQDRVLARATGAQVMAAIESQGYYLQTPVGDEHYMQLINRHNSKLGQS